MNKTRLLLALIAFANPAQAEPPNIYGNIHLSVGQFDKGLDDNARGELAMRSHTSSVGVEGRAKLDYGFFGIYQVEFQYDASERNRFITDRDQWVGIVGKRLGTVRLGTISTNYKTSGETVDPLYRTPFEARGFINAQSALHSGAGPLGGRSPNTVRYDSPRIAGMQVVANYALHESRANTLGAGVRYIRDRVAVYADGLYDNQIHGKAVKAGGAYRSAHFMVGAQYEMLDRDMVIAKATAGEGLAMSASYDLGGTLVAINFGVRKDRHFGAADSTGWAVAVDQRLGEASHVYLGYGDFDSRNDTNDNAGFAIGLRQYF